MRQVTFNRTSLELKLGRVGWSNPFHCTFNRTSLELKQQRDCMENRPHQTFNRTSLELKRKPGHLPTAVQRDF